MRTRLWTTLLQVANNMNDDAIIKGIIVFWCGLMVACILYSSVLQIGMALFGQAG